MPIDPSQVKWDQAPAIDPNAVQWDAPRKEDSWRSTVSFVNSNLGKGLAGLAGMPMDTMVNLANIGIAATGFAMREFGGAKPESMPELIDPEKQFGGSASIERGMNRIGLMHSDAGKPDSTGGEYAARAIQFAGGSAVPLSKVASVGQLAGQTLMGGVSGLTSMAAEKAMPGTPLAGIAGSMIPAVVAAPLGAIRPGQGAFKNPQAQEMEQLSKQHDVPLTAGELSGHAPILKGAETNLEKVPVVGTAAFRKTQAKAAEAAARRTVESLRGDVLDVGESINTSLRDTLKTRKTEAKAKYDRVEELMQKPGVQNIVRAEKTAAATEELLKTYPDLFERLPSDSVKKKLEALRDARRPGPTSSPFVPAGDGLPPSASITFEEARYLRGQLNNYIGRARKSAGAVGSDELRKLSILKGALDEDIDAFGARLPQNSEAHKAFREATDFYRGKVIPFEDPAIRRGVKRDVDTDTVFKMFVKPDRPVLASKAKAQMGAKGQQAMQYGVLRHAFDKAMDDRTGLFSPQVFSTELDKLSKTNGVIFTPEKKAQLDGLSKLMSAAKRGGQFMENPPTGNRLVQAGATGGVIGAAVTHPASIPAIATLAAGTKGLSWLLTSESGKRLLLQAAKTPEQSRAWDDLVKRAAVIAARNSIALHGLDDDNQEQPARSSPRSQ